MGTAQRRVCRTLGPLMTQWGFYLGGGTALALHLGHRRSVDLDWFTEAPIADPLRLAQELRDQGIAFVTSRVERGTLHGSVSGVRVSLLEYRYPLLKRPLAWVEMGCRIAAREDLACMKLAALVQRGAKKDFVDIYALGLEQLPLQKMLRLYQQKYALQDIAHVLYGLVYFQDADKERMPTLLWRAHWPAIKKTIQQWVSAETR